MARQRATELEYLKWFKQNVDFGLADSDALDALDQQFMNETGKNLPIGWNHTEDGESVMDR